MDQSQGKQIIFDLFESSGIGLVGLDAKDRIAAANPNVGVYLGLEPAALLDASVDVLRPAIRSDEFWAAFPGTFYCLAPGPQSLLLIVARRLEPHHDSQLRRAIIMRPYSLEREFGRMRVSLNNYLAHEVASRLNSVGIASEFIAEPELRESASTREAFVTTFRQDVEELNTLFVQLLETAEQLAMPNRVVRTPIDWKALVEDLVAKIGGLASEKSVELSCHLPTHLPAVSGDYHWLYLGLYGAISHALRTAPPLSEVAVSVRVGEGRLATVITSRRGDPTRGQPWPPPALFALDDEHPRIGRIAIDDIAVTRAIFLLHDGELRVVVDGEHAEHRIDLPV